MGFWNGKRVFITGSTGFKGSWLSLWLHRLGANLRGYALKPDQKKSIFLEQNIFELFPTTYNDIRDDAALFRAMTEFKPEIVFHLAAQPLVRYSYLDPRSTFETNIMGTVNLIEGAMRCNSVKCLVNVTSDKVYENKSLGERFVESDALNGGDPYSNSKSCADLIASCYRKVFLNEGMNLANVRSGNVIGGGDWAENRLIPDMIRSVLNKRPMEVRNPQSTRPWQHVLEPLYGYMLLAERLYSDSSYAEDWNFGPSDLESFTVEHLIERFRKFWKRPVRLAPKNESFEEAIHLRLDATKSTKRLCWEPKWDLDKSISKTFQWYKQDLEGRNMKAITIQQINEYSRNQEVKW